MQLSLTHNREISGIILLDKPFGKSSNAALQEIKKIVGAKKAGHTGSLDPLATGMLPICLGEATKFSQFLLISDKTYYVKARLGITTTTGDAEGGVLEEISFSDLSQQQVEQSLFSFQGELKQKPPMFSAVKKNGQPLYKLARQGIEVDREERLITIHFLKFLSYKNSEIEFTVHCSKGTYIRTLVEDIGKLLGCGAHVSELRRLSVGSYNESDMLTTSEILSHVQEGNLNQCILPIDTTVIRWPALMLSKEDSQRIHHGQTFRVHAHLDTGPVRLLNDEGEFIGVAELQEGNYLKAKRLLNSLDRRKSDRESG